jgi:monoamine oxidase
MRHLSISLSNANGDSLRIGSICTISMSLLRIALAWSAMPRQKSDCIFHERKGFLVLSSFQAARAEAMPTLFTSLQSKQAPSQRAPQFASFTSAVPQTVNLASFARQDLFSIATAPKKIRKDRRLLVVGAGFAGLASAYEAQSVGYSVTVLEGQNKLGGRVWSLSDVVPGKVVEGGGELIGLNHPTWLAYKDRFKLNLLKVTDSDDSPIVLRGHVLSHEEEKQLAKEMPVVLDQLNTLAKPVLPDTPWLSPAAKALDEQPLAKWIRDLKASPICKRAVRQQMEADNGVRAGKQSLLANLAMIAGGGFEKYWTDSERFRCDGGNQTLALKLGEILGDSLHLNCPVKSISVYETGVRVTTHSSKTFEADDVILAVPPSVWSKIRFTPGLPKALRSPGPQMGKNVKFLVNSKNQFWGKTAPNYVSDGAANLTWEGTEGQTGPGEGFIVFSGAASAERCIRFKPLRRAESYVDALRDVYPKLERSFTDSKFMDWPNDPWVLASYAFPAPNEVMRCGPIFEKGLYGRLHFAGEHTSYAFMGYMEGALHSGVMAAKKLAQRDGLTS